MHKKIFLLITVSFFSIVMCAQNCPQDYYAFTYNSGLGQNFMASSVNSNEEIFLAGSSPVYNSSENAGLVTKLTQKGSVLWSKNIFCPGYGQVYLNKIFALADGSIIATGNAFSYDSISYNLLKGWGIALKIDAYGKIVWSKAFSNYYEELNTTVITSAIKISDNDFILLGTLYGRQFPYYIVRGPQVLMHMDASGNILWKTTVTSAIGFEIGQYISSANSGFLITNGGKNIVLGLSLVQHKLEGLGYGDFIKQGYCIMNIDFASGKIVWRKEYSFPSKQDISGTFFGGITKATQLPNGDFAFSFSFSNFESFIQPPYTERSAVMFTSQDGTLKKVISYYNSIPGCYTTDAADIDAAGNQLMLLDDGRQPLLMTIDADGKIQSQKACGNLMNTFSPISIHKANDGFYILGNNSNAGNLVLLKLDADTSNICATSPVNMVSEDVTNLFTPTVSDFTFQYGKEALPYFALYSRDYPVTANNICYQACCRDTLDIANTKQIQICEGNYFTLPSNYKVYDSGTYYAQYKTVAGCDSFAFYHVGVLKKPDTLRISASGNCLDISDSIILTATAGYDLYNWKGINTANNTFTVTQGGVYSVSVQNSCGALTSDSFVIYDKCNSIFSMPSAFTPNGDGRNDVFRIPPTVQVPVKKFVIYSRWGQKVFESAISSQGWDGTFKGMQQPLGTYVYFIETQAPDGKTSKIHGLVTLLR